METEDLITYGKLSTSRFNFDRSYLTSVTLLALADGFET